jgi:hypothetical protein
MQSVASSNYGRAGKALSKLYANVAVIRLFGRQAQKLTSELLHRHGSTKHASYFTSFFQGDR